MSTFNSLTKNILNSTLLLSTLLIAFGGISLPTNAMASYKLPVEENAKYTNLTKKSSITELASLYQKPFSDDLNVAQQEAETVKNKLAQLTPDELIAFKRVTRQYSTQDKTSKDFKKREILMDKFDRDFVKSIEGTYGTGKTQYTIPENDKKNLDNYIKNDKNLLDLAQKFQNPDLIPDSILDVKAQAATSICGWDTNWPSNIPVGAWNWQGPTYWYSPSGSGDARNGATDVLCDFKVWGVPTNMVAVHGRNYQGGDAIDCWSSLIARSGRNETMSGSGCAIQAGIWHHWDLKNNIKYRRNY